MAPRPTPAPRTPRAFTCRCGRPIFFRNSRCLACGRALGYDPERAALIALDEAAPQCWREADAAATAPLYRRCRWLDTPSGCNWLVAADDRAAEIQAEGDAAPQCRCCRLLRTLPDLGLADNVAWFSRIELARRRLVSTLIGLRLPVHARAGDEPPHGLAFDLLHAPPGGPPVVTGHADGVITLDIEEADDPVREQRRTQFGEPYRTLLGHLRHETGHYYWQRLVEPGARLHDFRCVFGDERADYAAALQTHHAQGAPADWNQRHVSAYASAHPWEDWAETFAHYLHLVDTLDTARSFGLDGERVELDYEPFDAAVLGDDAKGTGGREAAAFLALVRSWMELTGVLNELSRAMGVADFYPFVLPAPAVRKLWLVHRVVAEAAA
jgi:hypothetical protein